MKDSRPSQGTEPSALPPPGSAEKKSKHNEAGDGRADLPLGWQNISTGLPWARLFHVGTPHGGVGHWLAELKLNGQVMRRRFVSELHARWWIAVLDEPHRTVAPSGAPEFRGALPFTAPRTEA